MPGIAFTNLAMLAGLMALSVPIVIHLLLRRKKKRLRFSTVQFFLQRDERSSQRRKLQNWLLLALRLLICTLLVLVFARPYLRNNGLGTADPLPRRVVIVLDRSLSMQAMAADGPKWTQSIDAARKVLNGLSAKDRAALVGCGARTEVLSEWSPPAAIGRMLNDLGPTCGAGQMGEALQQASRLITVAEAQAASTVWVISDFQRTTCTSMDAARLPKKTELKLVKIGDLLTPNLAVTDLKPLPMQGLPPHVALTSYSDEDVRDLQLQVAVDGAEVKGISVTLTAGSGTNVDLTLPLGKPGWHDVRVQLRARDSLGLDDTRFATVFVPRPARVLIAETRPSQRVFEQENFFVSTALDPLQGSTNGMASSYAVEIASPDEVARRLAAAKAGELACDLVVLPGLKQVPSALGKALTSHVHDGGGALLFLGDGLSANRYNAEFRGLLPAQLGEAQSSPDWESSWRIGDYATNSAIFAAFQTERSGDLSLARFTRRFTLAGADAGAVPARFRDGTPFLVVGAIGKGRVVLVNTTADTSWNDWAKHKTFVPWVHSTARHLLPPSSEHAAPVDSGLLAGSIADLDAGATMTNAVLKLRVPDGTTRDLASDGIGQLHDVTFPVPGVYVLTDREGHEIRRLAANVPSAESDLASWTAADFEQRVARATEEPTTLVAGLLGTGSNQRELWRVLLLTVLGLLMVELVVANRSVV